MDAIAEFDLGDRRYSISSSTAVQLHTIKTVIGAYYNRARIRGKIGVPKSIVDVGACIGLVSLSYAAIWPEAEILAIEPHPETYRYLQKNAANFDHIYPLQLAASNKRERIRIAMPLPEQRPGAAACSYDLLNIGMVSRYGKSDLYAASVNAVPLDELISGPVDLIKIDVEGSELLVLEGAKKTIEKYKPVLVVEFRPENMAMAGIDFRVLSEWLDCRGYRLRGKLHDDPMFAREDRWPI